MTDPAAAPLLRVRELRREYPSPDGPIVILDGVNVDLDPAKSMSVMGRSGSGKSTLLQILGVLDQPSSGTVEFEGSQPHLLNRKRQAIFRNTNIGFVFQDHHLLPQCSVLENVLIPSLVHPGKKKDIEDRAKSLIDRVGLSRRIHHRPGELSGGERQRVAVARSMINRPKLLLCDEPTGNLDQKSSESIGEIFRKLQAEEYTALVIVTHSPEFAAICDRRFQLADGKLCADRDQG
ncbi:ABC transporter ATP-binding protein [Candidatus Sumerlaeota bacterium]|nr:ABC transporter ATP-binding protein [Candidatus Sumerlaeota bacterium]